MSRFLGPVKNRDVGQNNNNQRGFVSNLPVGMGEVDFVEYYRDYLFAGDYAASDWVVTETQAGATQAVGADIVGGALVLTNDAGATDVNQIQSAEEWFKLTSGKRAWFSARFKTSDASLSSILVGFATTDTTPLTTTDCIGFRKLTGTTSLLSITEDATVEVTNALATMASDTYVSCSFYWDGISRVYFYTGEGSSRSLASVHTSSIEQTNKLALVLHITNGEAVAKILTVDYIYVAMER